MENEKRFIDANALLENLGEEPMVWRDGEAEIQERNDWQRFKACVEAQDTVDAVEVVHGRWEQKEFWIDGGTWRCSECGRQIMFMKGTPTTEKMHYCPNCGADMRGTEE